VALHSNKVDTPALESPETDADEYGTEMLGERLISKDIGTGTGVQLSNSLLSVINYQLQTLHVSIFGFYFRYFFVIDRNKFLFEISKILSTSVYMNFMHFCSKPFRHATLVQTLISPKRLNSENTPFEPIKST